MYRIIILAALAAALASVGAHAQEDGHKTEMKVMVSADGGEPTVVRWVGDDANLDNLAVGESRTITAGDGSGVVVTRTDAGLQFDVNGETVVVPDMHGDHMAFVGAGVDQEIDVQVAGGDGEDVDVTITAAGTHAIPVHQPEGVTIISGEPLDDSVRESIRSVLISAGVDEEVRFIDSNENRQVHVIRKRVETVE
jgi:hypothetical protein